METLQAQAPLVPTTTMLSAKKQSIDVPFAMAVPVPLPPPESSSLAMVVQGSTNQVVEFPQNAAGLDDATLQTLQKQGYSLGMAKSLGEVKKSFAKRIFIIDNSGSMQRNDGHRLVDVNGRNTIKVVPCTRFEELRDTINYHIRLTGLIQAPTSFRLLNHPVLGDAQQIFGVAEGHEPNNDTIAADIERGLNIMRRINPYGCTPLVDHIRCIHQEVLEMAPELRASGQRISVTIATDGLPSDPYGRGGPEHNQAFVDSLRQLEGLPVWLVIRLCTDEDSVVEYYNSLDEMLELSVEVLDDCVGEAEEIHRINPWLNYGLPLHRLREVGYHDRVLDMLDERPLTLSELQVFCHLLFDGADAMEGIPDPSVDWNAFLKVLKQLMATEKLQWQNPISRRMEPWLDIKMLDFLYGDSCNHLPCHPLQIFQWFQCMTLPLTTGTGGGFRR
ncbi:expressed unknown protein [Seminavis robusta]|uniref:VWFA domain-containing protein n=1 Tax=Seminavis robusta TaxID=568900 RepID=A0A9N8HCN6_9STRA|nr:expressed unknown protein [Seminavis robusta]|eukprot:Sro309_g113910.2  (445) ;mRNA; r:71151-72658